MSNLRAPDFDDMMALADKIAELSRRASLLDTEIKIMVGEVTSTVMSDQKYFVGGKQPSMEYVKSVYQPAGLNGEIKYKRNELSNIEGELEECKLKFQIYRDMITMYVTDSANARASIS